MKKLFTLMIIWLCVTFWLAYDNHVLRKFQEENVAWRAFLVYTNTRLGCESGILFMIQRGSDNPDDSHAFCLRLSYQMKDIYNERWKLDHN